MHIQLPCPHTSAGLHIVCAHTSACLVTTEFRSAHLYIRSSLACTSTVTLKSLQVNLSIYPICAGISVLACCVRSSIHPRYIPRSNLQSALCHIRWLSVTLAHLYITASVTLLKYATRSRLRHIRLLITSARLHNPLSRRGHWRISTHLYILTLPCSTSPQYR